MGLNILGQSDNEVNGKVLSCKSTSSTTILQSCHYILLFYLINLSSVFVNHGHLYIYLSTKYAYGHSVWRKTLFLSDTDCTVCLFLKSQSKLWSYISRKLERGEANLLHCLFVSSDFKAPGDPKFIESFGNVNFLDATFWNHFVYFYNKFFFVMSFRVTLHYYAQSFYAIAELCQEEIEDVTFKQVISSLLDGALCLMHCFSLWTHIVTLCVSRWRRSFSVSHIVTLSVIIYDESY